MKNKYAKNQALKWGITIDVITNERIMTKYYK